MDSFTEPRKMEMARNARPGLLHLMRNHLPHHAEPSALLEVADAYLRLNPDDQEVSEARDRVGEGDPRVGR